MNPNARAPKTSRRLERELERRDVPLPCCGHTEEQHGVDLYASRCSCAMCDRRMSSCTREGQP
jgi:hypothetical protein